MEDTHNKIHTKLKKQQKYMMYMILIGCILLQAFPYCVALNLNNVFVGTDWIEWTNGNQTLVSSTFTIAALGAGFSGPFIAKRMGRPGVNIRVIYSIGIIAAMLGFASIGFNALIPESSRSIAIVVPILWVGTLISQVGVMVFSGLGINNLIQKWWPAEKRGTALGLAFAGGSLGNIFMQQIAGKLSEIFGNGYTGPNYDKNGDQYYTYFILAAIGLVFGIIIIMVIGKKPLPIISDDEFVEASKNKDQVCVNCNNVFQANGYQKIQQLEVNPLVAGKYPFYWILAGGYLILQMGTIFSSMNGSFIAHATLRGAGKGQEFFSVIATGGSIFGVSCLIGNSLGGYINDRIGPNKSIFLAGMIQCAAILSLLYSVKVFAFVYVYYALAGLCIYLYTSTPAYISGKLYGSNQSTNHLAILGIFIAGGFALTNLITGSITGSVGVDASGVPISSNTLFGVITAGNFKALGIFAIVCMLSGTLIVSTSATFILRKGIKGMIEYSPTKYSSVVFWKNGFSIKINALKIILKSHDFRDEKYLAKRKTKSLTNIKSLDAKEQLVLKNTLEKLVKKKTKSLAKVNSKLLKVDKIKVNLQKSELNDKKIQKKISKLQKSKEQKLAKLKKENVEWRTFKINAINDQKINALQTKMNQAENIVKLKKEKLNKKIATINYIYEYNVKKQNEGHQLLLNYYNDFYYVYDNLLNAKINESLDYKLRKIHNKVGKSQIEFTKLSDKKEKIDLNLYQPKEK